MRIIHLHLIIVISLLLAFASSKLGLFKKSSNKMEPAKEVIKMANEDLSRTIDLEKSSILWNAFQGKERYQGSFLFKRGALFYKDSVFLGGDFTVDMASIRFQLIEDTAKSSSLQEKMLGLDFFDLAQHPEAQFQLTGFKKKKNKDYDYLISGNLTFKKEVRNISFWVKFCDHGDHLYAETEPIRIDMSKIVQSEEKKKKKKSDKGSLSSIVEFVAKIQLFVDPEPTR